MPYPMLTSTGSGQKAMVPGTRLDTQSDWALLLGAIDWVRRMHEPATAIPFSYNLTGNVVLVPPEGVNTETSPRHIFDRSPSGAISLLSSTYETPIVTGLVESYRALLKDALCDLAEAKIEAREEGFPLPSDIALENAERLLEDMYRIAPRRFEVYPTPDGEIAIGAPGGHGRSVLLLCASDGGALCLVNLSGAHRRARYSTADTLPDGFLREALADLKQ